MVLQSSEIWGGVRLGGPYTRNGWRYIDRLRLREKRFHTNVHRFIGISYMINNTNKCWFTRFSTIGALTFEDQFIQFTSAMASTYLYGFGENSHSKLRHTFEPRDTWPIFARDQPHRFVSGHFTYKFRRCVGTFKKKKISYLWVNLFSINSVMYP